MAKRAASSGTPATVLLDRVGVPYTLHSFEHDPGVASYGLEAAERLGFSSARVFKTLMVSAGPLLAAVIIPVATTLDLKACGAALGVKRASMADPVLAQRRTGYVLGGISPLGQRQASPTTIDRSALAFPSIVVSAGRRGLEIELAPQDLVRLADAGVADVASG
ncbi:transcriptional regulator [Arthrobacter crystallopoietes BAB-32]|uniref:Cys-tRNA(Pro)/Cys-tRNA(Cys) deacylase n=1 Tax=Arthrobacter crystallopoietes BAB-32 TaxID=1246476 RepID=N1V1T8_9MICC|nr:Cys-tRNA(Pro) deacylase [Arthrobacter crystallopoietes]EMY33964.1 transcriptional regulator [Arthrobacter crystallopoietes BAB-32]